MATPTAPAPASAPAGQQGQSGPGPLPSFAEIVGPAAGGQPPADQGGLDFLPQQAPAQAPSEAQGQPEGQDQQAQQQSALEALLASLPEDQRAAALAEFHGLRRQAGRTAAAARREAELQAHAQAAEALARAVRVSTQGVPLAQALQAAGIDPAALGVTPQAPAGPQAAQEGAPAPESPRGFVGHLYNYIQSARGALDAQGNVVAPGWGTQYLESLDNAALLAQQADEALANAAVSDDPKQRINLEKHGTALRRQAREAQLNALIEQQKAFAQPIYRALREMEDGLAQRFGPIEQAWQRAQQADAAQAQVRQQWRSLASEMSLLRDDEGNLAFGPDSAFPIFGVDAEGNATEPTEQGVRVLQHIDKVLSENRWQRDREGFQRAITFLIGQMALSGNLPTSEDEQQGDGYQAAPGGGMTTLPGPGLAPGAPMRPSVNRPGLGGPGQDYERMFDQRGQQR